MPFGPDLAQILTALRQRVFDAQEYYFLLGDEGLPATIDELWADECVQEDGTHSILDIFRVIGSDDEDGYGTLRPLRPEELVRDFGTLTPTRETFDRAHAAFGEGALTLQGRRWSGYCAVLYDHTGAPAEIAVWGYSGD